MTYPHILIMNKRISFVDMSKSNRNLRVPAASKRPSSKGSQSSNHTSSFPVPPAPALLSPFFVHAPSKEREYIMMTIFPTPKPRDKQFSEDLRSCPTPHREVSTYMIGYHQHL
ncbi:hypothetical protein AAMO2058_001627900 [Amorphochlora amoebiformis]